ncbi:MAG: S8 family serine peptidase [Nitrososphaerota archaeon]
MEFYKIIFFSVVVVFCTVFILSNIENGQKIEAYLEKSVPLIGADLPRNLGFEGVGIKIAVIDTGIDYNHPDLFGFGPDGKVVGGYDYVDKDEEPMDTNGHGTEVAGIIAANGILKGVAPKAKLIAYRVSSTGESVSSDFIVEAIHRAIEDQVDIINISLGVNKTNDKLDSAVKEAVRNGIVVVAAAGNNGPGIGTIGSPAKSVSAITVGASYNNITSSLVSTFEVEEKQYQVLPMLGTTALSEPITARVVFGGYGRVHELDSLDLKDSILLVERGSDVKGETIYFSEKEHNAAQSGAKAVIVYNNEAGIFFGELAHPNADSGYRPTIPALSMSRDDGLALKEVLQKKTSAKLNVFYHPDFVTPFSSRGPVSPFYIKPDLVAPGVFVNSTLTGGKYNLTSGTSFAAPHVSGAIALLLEKNSDLKPSEVASILSTTSEPVSNPYGSIFPVEVSGSGRINLTRAFSADMIIVPHNLVFNISLEKPFQEKSLHLKSIQGVIPPLEIEFLVEESGINFEHSFESDLLNVMVSLTEEKLGDFEGMLILRDGKTRYHIPILIHITKGTINAIEKDGMLSFSLDYPKTWSYAKISVISIETGQTRITSITPEKIPTLVAYDAGENWIEAQITTQNGTDTAYGTITVQHPSEKTGLEFFELLGIPLKHILIISGILVAAVIVGLRFRHS